MTGALENLKVVDLSRFIAGPLCGMLLGDMGADVIKVERRGRGEDARSIAPFAGGESLYTMVFNRNKRGMTLDFRHPNAVALLRAIIAEADVLVENFRPGVMESMGLGWEEVSSFNPRLVMVRVSGFGQDGPYAQRPCFDGIAQAMGGLMETTGEPGGRPLPAGTFLVDQVTGVYAALGTLAALNVRHQTGRGQMVDTALLDVASSLLVTAIPEWLLHGRELTRQGPRDRYSAPVNTYKARDDRWIHFTGGNDTMFPRLAAAMGRPDLLADARFSSHAARMAHVAEIESIVAGWVAGLDVDDVAALLDDADLPCAKVATISEVVANPQLRARNQIVEVDHPTIGSMPMVGPAVRLSETPSGVRRAGPSVGQHRGEILRDWLGYDEDQIQVLCDAGVI